MSVAATGPDASPLPAGFEELYARHHDFVWRCALRMGASPADVEDIVQETFMVALRRYDQTEFRQGGARPSNWLFAILRNVLRNHARGDRRRRTFLAAFAETRTERQPPHGGVQSALGLRLLDEFLHELEPDRRAVFVLAEFEGLRGPEIARVLELNANTVRSRLRAARQAFEARFEHEHERGQLVEAASNDAAPREARARGLVLLGLPVDPWVSANTSAKLGWFATRSGLGRGLVSVALSSSVLVGVALVGNIGEPTPHELVVENASDASAKTRAGTNHADGPVPNAPETANDVMRAEPAIVVQARSKRSAQVPTLDQNAALDRLTLARRALLEGDAATCLSLVAADEAWPPALDARRVALEIGALCKLDQPERAQARAAAWVREHPNANVAVDLHAACWNDDNTPASSGH
jgi:RNA polymerase sigma factor (sigma-70 family)